MSIWTTLPSSRLSLMPHEVHVFAVDLEKFLPEADALLELLSKEELQRAERFVSSSLSNNYIVAHAVLRKILAKYLDCSPKEVAIGVNAQGKPGLTNKELEFNMSHTRGVALYAVALEAVGIDVEVLSRDVSVEDIAERFFTKSEYELLCALPVEQRQKAFYQCWTLKEAFIKALGEGLAYGLDRFEVDFTLNNAHCLKSIEDSEEKAEGWALQPLLYSENTVAALALRGTLSSLKCWLFE